MRSVILTTSLVLYSVLLFAQNKPYATRIIEYRPAPGQFINDPASGTPAAATGVLDEPGNPLSLGGYGGYIILGFDHRIMNDPSNPYGVDFTVFGNSAQTLPEQGIIKVMKDENNNGLPDDTWYEIAGSDHFTGKLKKNYSITYFNPGNSANGAVPWKDNYGVSGFIPKNNFHTQNYYPVQSLFPQINNDSLGFTGSLLTDRVKKIKGLFVSLPSAFGYADNTPVNHGNSYTVPDNPYTPGIIENSGGDAIDISWAMDSAGNYAELDGIDFVMIHTGVNETAAWLGEISTEIRAIADVSPDPGIRGQTDLILALNFPGNIPVSTVFNLRTLFFEKGRITNRKDIQWISSDNSVAWISNDSVITTFKEGKVKLSARLKNSFQNLFEDSLTVCVPSGIRIEDIPSFIRKDEVFSLYYSVLDKSGEKLTGLIPDITITGLDFLQLIHTDEGKLTLKALNPGIAYINFHIAGLSKSQKIEINDITKEFEVSVSMNIENDGIIPRKIFSVSRQDLKKYIDRMDEGFVAGRNFVSIADVLVSVLLKEGYDTGPNTFSFRQDEKANHQLYLWQFGMNYEFTYGWGGTENIDSYAKCWIAVLNEKVFANAWDTIQVQPNDIISFRHVNDIRNGWKQIQLVAEKQVTLPGEELRFTVRQLVVSYNQKNDISLSGPFLLPDAKVLVNESYVLNNNSPLVSDYTGEFKLKFNSGGNYNVRIDNESSEETLINVGFPLNNNEPEINSPVIFPNPCIDEIHVTGISGIKYIKIITLEGRVIRNYIIPEGEGNINIDLSNVEAGVYIMEIGTGDRRFNKMIIKNQQ